MKRIMEKLETLLEWGGLKKEIILLVISGIFRLLCNIKDSFFPIHAAAVDFSFPDVVKF